MSPSAGSNRLSSGSRVLTRPLFAGQPPLLRSEPEGEGWEGCSSRERMPFNLAAIKRPLSPPFGGGDGGCNLLGHVSLSRAFYGPSRRGAVVNTSITVCHPDPPPPHAVLGRFLRSRGQRTFHFLTNISSISQYTTLLFLMRLFGVLFIKMQQYLLY